MSFISLKRNNNQFTLFSFIFFILILLIQIANVKSFPSNLSGVFNYNNTMLRYQRIIINFNALSKKMKKITLNIILQIKFEDLKKDYDKLKPEILELKEKYEKNESISEGLKGINKNLTNFEIKFKKTLKSYNRFDEFKKTILNMIKVFILIISIIVFVVLVIIGIGSYFVLKKQKYHELQEEISIRISQNEEKFDKDKETNLEEKEKKIIYSAKSTQEDINSVKNMENNNKSESESNNPISKDFLKNKKN